MILTLLLSAGLWTGSMVAGCSKSPAPAYAFDQTPVSTVSQPADAARHVAVVMNIDSPDSEAIASYYVKKRGIPHENVIAIRCPPQETIDWAVYKEKVLTQVQEGVHSCSNPIDYIVTTKGVPMIAAKTGLSCDAALVMMDKPDFPTIGKLDEGSILASQNPYYSKDAHFSHQATGMYLVCRLDGYTTAQAEKLVDNSLAAKPLKGLFYFQTSPIRTGSGFGDLQATMTQAYSDLTSSGMTAKIEMAKVFTAPTEPLMGYCTWGSNNGSFNRAAYDSIKFQPGAICETFVSTSGRTLQGPQPTGQSQIGDLIASGVTGIKGYVSEPYTFALCRANILFDRYVKGYNLAESFYMASPEAKWKGVVIGDPLCAPYAKKAS